MPFGMWTQLGPVKHVLDEGAQWRHLANTIDAFVHDRDAVFLSNFFDHLLFLSQTYAP